MGRAAIEMRYEWNSVEDLIVASWRKCSLSTVTLLKVRAANMVSRNDNGNGDGDGLSL
jgi:hypothetical protein